jgi:hypothetical protein
MKKGWTTTKLVAVGSIAVVRFLVRILIYVSILLATGSVFAGVLALIIAPFFIIFAALIVNQFGAATIFSLISFFVDLPTPSIFPKIVNFFLALVAGLTLDALFLLLRPRKKSFSFWGGFIFNFAHLPFCIILYFTVGLPGTENIPRFIIEPNWIVSITFLVSILGGIFGLLGYFVYEKIKSTAVVKRIQR